jgi:hypothetical protein
MNYIFRSKHTIAAALKAKGGLWKVCSPVWNLGQLCFDIQNEGTKLLAARAFVTLACIMSVISALLLFSSVATSDYTKQILLMVGKSLAFACLIMGVVGVALGINVTTETVLHIKSNWGASAIIGVIAIVLNFCGAIVSVLIK